MLFCTAVNTTLFARKPVGPKKKTTTTFICREMPCTICTADVLTTMLFRPWAVAPSGFRQGLSYKLRPGRGQTLPGSPVDTDPNRGNMFPVTETKAVTVAKEPVGATITTCIAARRVTAAADY